MMCFPATDLGTSPELPPLLHLAGETRALLRAAEAAAAALLAAAAARVSARDALSRAMDASRLEFRESRGFWARLSAGREQQCRAMDLSSLLSTDRTQDYSN